MAWWISWVLWALLALKSLLPGQQSLKPFFSNSHFCGKFTSNKTSSVMKFSCVVSNWLFIHSERCSCIASVHVKELVFAHPHILLLSAGSFSGLTGSVHCVPSVNVCLHDAVFDRTIFVESRGFHLKLIMTFNCEIFCFLLLI